MTTVQVVDFAGAVIRASVGAQIRPIIDAAQLLSQRGAISATVPGDGDMRVSTERMATTAGPLTVVVGTGEDDLESTITRVAVLLAAGTPLVVAIAASATFLPVGRSLRSVEQVRSRVSEISAADLSERLPVSVHRDEITSLAETMNAMLSRIETGHLT